MSMPQRRPPEAHSLWQSLGAAGRLSKRWLLDDHARVSLAALSRGSTLGRRLEELRGRSVLLSTRDQLPAALALIELDGIARRIVLCPPDVASAHMPGVMATAAVEAAVGDRAAVEFGGDVFLPASTHITPGSPNRDASESTEWVLLTSGTTGVPKLVRHTLATLTGAMPVGTTLGHAAVWSTFYDMRRYGGLQIFLRAMLGGGSMVLSSALESVSDFLGRASARGVTHISGTPSHWRRALMSSAADKIAPRYVRLSGEIADQAILDHLRAAYPDADIAHAFASTEAGVAFDVGDGLAGFPASYLGRRGDVEMRVVDGSLRIKSGRNSLGYLDEVVQPFDDDGFVDTGDIVELDNERYYFVGRQGGVINIGGQKVHPEEIEAVINRHPDVQMSLVRARKNPITGSIVVADVVVTSPHPPLDALKGQILEACRGMLARYKVPAAIRFVPAIEVAASGKLARVRP
ncbi:MAG TPA: fatty acid--CoA ligase family protein [Stellaceae bacterium]|nr:fatty acid--CoA ligase family protein [Stellaceae bacterium]